jgi:hypothetical protein
MGWRGVKKGALLDLMAEEFQTIVTTDKNLPSTKPHQTKNCRRHSSIKSNSNSD